MKQFPILFLSILLLALPLTNLLFAQNKTSRNGKVVAYRFDFGSGRTAKRFTKVLPGSLYTEAKGFGLEQAESVTANSPTGKESLTDGYLTSAEPFYFSVALPEGNYHVKITLGDDAGTSDASIRAECRRMMVNRVQTVNGEHKTVEFTLHIRDSLIRNSDKKVKLKSRERGYRHWDNKLTLEFNGPEPKINAIEITPEVPEVVTVFLAGNSTVVDGSQEPYSAWGQMFPAFFKPGKVAIANYAESGETLSGFIAERRFEKILSLMKPGDYVFVEFGHNDQKQKGEGIGAFTSYKKNLEFFIGEVRKKGATPVVVTSVQRRRFDAAGKIEETLGDYPEAGRVTAQEQGVPLIDLNAYSKVMYEAWGPDESIKAFVHFPANTFPDQPKALEDNTHFTPFGAYEVARLVVKGVRDAKIGLADFILEDVPEIDPAKPGTFSSFYWPLSPLKRSVKPDGN
jgi:lysophospholipase L1-like esterase